MQTHLPDDKLARIQSELSEWHLKKYCTRKELKHLIRVLQFACNVVPQKGYDFPITHGSSLCPVSALLDYLTVCNSNPVHCFRGQMGSLCPKFSLFLRCSLHLRQLV